MTAEMFDIPADETVAARSFYVPHDRSATWYTGELVDPNTGEISSPPSMTKQEFVKECDINNILTQYKLTGQIRHISAKAAMGVYDDLPDPIDFQESMNLILAAEDSFATLPAHVRSRFGNDPTEFLSFMANPANQDEIIKLGLATDKRPPAPTNPTAPPSPTPPPEPSPTVK